jgi:2-(1,2-epoxy-1,2-dihydrophenyl)acetyl-CoA isomerase
VRLLGLRRATEFSVLPQSIDAETAHDLGLVNRVVPLASLEQSTKEFASGLATGPTLAFARIKRLLREASGNSLQQQLSREHTLFLECAGTEDFNEGVAAFLDRRAAKFYAR